MYTNVLIPLDGSHGSESAVHEAATFAPTLRSVYLVLVESRLHPLQYDGYTVYAETVSDIREETGIAYLQPFRKKLEALGVEVDTAVIAGDPVTAIAELSRNESIDLILLGAGEGWAERYSGPAYLASRLTGRVDATVMAIQGAGRRISERGRARAAPVAASDPVPGIA